MHLLKHCKSKIWIQIEYHTAFIFYFLHSKFKIRGSFIGNRFGRCIYIWLITFTYSKIWPKKSTLWSNYSQTLWMVKRLWNARFTLLAVRTYACIRKTYVWNDRIFLLQFELITHSSPEVCPDIKINLIICLTYTPTP